MTNHTFYGIHQIWQKSETNLVENQKSFCLHLRLSLEDIAQTCTILCFTLIIGIISIFYHQLYLKCLFLLHPLFI